jgi:DNA repair exonuclease SbcCD nuclease subunit
MKKVVLFSDLHLDSAFAWMSGAPEAARRRRQALRDTLLKIIETTVEAKADALLCGGDLYEHDRVTPDTAEFLKSAFERLGSIRVFIAPGNHDWYGPQSLYRTVEWSPNVQVFDHSRLQPVELEDGLTLWGAAHQTPANTPGFLDGFKVKTSGIHLALFHGSERGWFTEQGEGKAQHAPFDAEQIVAAGIHHAFLGHYHGPRDYDRLTYPGNPDPLSFGEDGSRGAVVATIREDGSIEREHVSVAVTEVHDITVDVTGCGSQQDVRDRAQEAIQALRGVVRLTMQGEMAPAIDLRRHDILSLPTERESLAVEMGGLYVGYDLEAIKNEATVRGEFVRQVTAVDLLEDERRRVLVTGLRALDGRDDLEVR